MEEKKDPPVKRVRPCSGFEIAVWENESKESEARYRKFELRKSWKDEKTGDWLEAKIRFTPAQLAATALAAESLFRWHVNTIAELNGSKVEGQ